MQDNLAVTVEVCVKDILLEVTQISSKDRPDIIWHYTNRDTLFKILETREIWSTHVSCLNDTSECLCKAPEILDTVLHKIHAASPRGVWAART